MDGDVAPSLVHPVLRIARGRQAHGFGERLVDIAGLELYLPLVTGASVEVGDRELALDPKALATRLRERGVTMFQATRPREMWSRVDTCRAKLKGWFWMMFEVRASPICSVDTASAPSSTVGSLLGICRPSRA